MTGAGAAAIAIVRLVGRHIDTFAGQCLKRQPTLCQCIHTDLHDNERLIDDVLAVRLDEQTLELHLHGGPWIVQACMELAERFGFAPAEWNDLSLDAFDGESILQREIAQAMPLATTTLGLQALLLQEAAWQQLSSRFDRQRYQATLDRCALHWLLHPPTIALIGVPNAGKSTIANRLAGQQRSITADQPGTTRDWVGSMVNIDGLPATLMDTPGLHDTADAIERTAIERSVEILKQVTLKLIVLDASRAPSEQLPLVARYPDALLVLNKIDRTTPGAHWPEAIATSAISDVGIDALRNAILKRFDLAEAVPSEPCCWTDRQRDALRVALHNGIPVVIDKSVIPRSSSRSDRRGCVLPAPRETGESR